MSAEVTKVTIRIGETEISLKPEEARGLRDVLNDLLGAQTPVIQIHTQRIYEPVREYPWIPWWFVRQEIPTQPAIIWCSTESQSTAAPVGPLAAGGQA